jgi:hypothetical protein
MSQSLLDMELMRLMLIPAVIAVIRGMRHWVSCKHRRMPMHEGKCFCPDCGQGIIVRWATLCCVGCGTRRRNRYLFGRFVPAEAYCIRCGEREVSVRFIDNPLFYQLRHARLVCQDEEEFLRAHSRLSEILIRAWFDPERLGMLSAASV